MVLVQLFKHIGSYDDINTINNHNLHDNDNYWLLLVRPGMNFSFNVIVMVPSNL
jgi:hypothetical protein